MLKNGCWVEALQTAQLALTDIGSMLATCRGISRDIAALHCMQLGAYRMLHRTPEALAQCEVALAAVELGWGTKSLELSAALVEAARVQMSGARQQASEELPEPGQLFTPVAIHMYQRAMRISVEAPPPSACDHSC